MSGMRLQDGEMTDVPSDVLKNPKLASRAKMASLGKGKKKRPKGFKPSMRDAGDALAAARF
jgi:hypothetical protein